MNPIGNMIAYWNRKVKKFTILDLKLAQGAALAFGLVIATLFPQITRLSVWWFVGLALVFALRPVHTIWIKTDDPGKE